MDGIGLGVGALQLMQQAGVEAAPIGAQIGPGDFSAMALFERATLTVQIVMAMLILASFWSWAIIVEKLVQFSRLRTFARQFENEFWSGQSLEDLYDRIGRNARSPAERVFVAGMTEWTRSVANTGGVHFGVCLFSVIRRAASRIASSSASVRFFSTSPSVAPSSRADPPSIAQ